MRKYIFKVLKEKNAIISIFLVFVHQLLIASSIFFLTNLILNYQKDTDYSFFLTMYLITMVIPYIPGCISFIYLQKWINNTHINFINLLKENANFNPLNFRNYQFKENLDSLASRNSFNVISTSLSFFHDFTALILNSFLSILMIAILLPSTLAIGYLASTLFSFILIIFTKKVIENYHIKTEKSFIKYSTLLSKISDNISIKNIKNEKYFNIELKKESECYYKSTLKIQYLKQALNIFLALIAMLPTCYLIYSILILNVSSAAVIAAIIVNLTRIFTLLSSLNSLLNYMIEIPGIIGQIKVLLSFLDDETSHVGKIHGLYINGKYFNSEEEMTKILLEKEVGRFTITGANGSGKSTLLHNLKNNLTYNSIFIPTNIQNLFWGVELEALSTGQKIKKILENILDSNEKFIILDEWDANLDVKNKKDLDSIIEELSMSKVIIEVTHSKKFS